MNYSNDKKWWDTSHTMDLVVKEADNLLKKYKNHRLIGLGQSPAWIIEAAKKITLLNNEVNDKTEFEHVAFSGKLFYTSVWGNEEQNIVVNLEYWHKQDPLNNDKGLILCFREYLTNLKITPQNIHNCYINNNQKTIIIDYIMNFQGLPSFIYILYTWALEENIDLTNSLIVVGYFTEYGFKKFNGEYTYPENDKIFFVEKVYSPIINDLQSRTEGYENGEELQDRIVRGFLPGEWPLKAPKKLDNNSNPIFGKIHNKLDEAIKRKQAEIENNKVLISLVEFFTGFNVFYYLPKLYVSKFINLSDDEEHILKPVIKLPSQSQQTSNSTSHVKSLEFRNQQKVETSNLLNQGRQ